MPQKRLTALAVSFALTGLPALAVTPDEVWADWQELITSYGATLEIGDESRSGETLTVSDVTISTEMPEGAFDVDLGDLSFTNTGNGEVRVDMAAAVPIRIDIVTEEG